jgi:hypothetical protein
MVQDVVEDPNPLAGSFKTGRPLRARSITGSSKRPYSVYFATKLGVTSVEIATGARVRGSRRYSPWPSASRTPTTLLR